MPRPAIPAGAEEETPPRTGPPGRTSPPPRPASPPPPLRLPPPPPPRPRPRSRGRGRRPGALRHVVLGERRAAAIRGEAAQVGVGVAPVDGLPIVAGGPARAVRRGGA